MKWINDLDLDDHLVNAKGFVVIAFVQRDSIPCRHYFPEFKALSSSMKGPFEFLILDADENPIAAESCLVNAVPTTVVFSKGDEIGRFEGPYNCAAIKRRIGDLVEHKKGT